MITDIRAKNSGKEIVDLPREKDSPSPAPSTTSQFENGSILFARLI